ncbi:PREDICTED: uncharacterized protein LOC109153702 isoform X2 [Ipomoea nil]|uniref:uncharacterized protein LOC109153702 isoform X2 n=1 Tax=Ipomoea nil TaxID=35883 RepID=UPI0009019ECD|nr:PREDICTED: uncharacterized protein LOC109153702 isoform X2 [Ipomoea nil]
MASTCWLFYKHLLGAFFLSVPSYFLALLLSFITSFIFRLRRGGGSSDKRFDFADSVSEESNSRGSEAESENNCEEFNGFADSENEPCLKFRFPTYEEFINRKEKDELRELVDSEVLLTSSSCTKHEFLSQSGFIEEPEVHNINIDVVDSQTKAVSLENQSTVALLDKNLEQSHCEEGDYYVHNKEMENSDNGGTKEEDEGTMLSWEKGELGKGAENQTQTDFELSDESQSLVTDSDSVSIGFEHMHGLISRLVDYYSDDGFLSDQDFGGEFEFGSLQGEEDIEKQVEVHHSEMSEEKNQVETHVVLEDHVGKLEQDHLDNLEILASQFLSENDHFHEEDEDELMNGSKDPNNEAVLDSGESNKLESLWEHQELIEQLQMELRKVRATGLLPTIFEESESSKMEDLKPWKIDERFQRGDCMGELHKFYRSYRERMRKFDIFTYQKMYAIGLLQKDPLQLLSSHKSPRPTFKSLLSQNLWLLKHKSHRADPMKKFIKELQSDLEVVYVGQMCLSWEFLNWQYGKALDLWDSDPHGVHQYNEVSGEFQQFQVLMQRFIEDEPFQGTRVQHYIKTRCDARNLLQVPVIREDSIKDRKKSSRRYESGDNGGITIEMIVETLEESIRIFWHFVKADKDCAVTTMKGQKGVHPDVQNAEDLELLMDVMKSLRKKENALKNILRSEQCILRRLRRFGDEDPDHVLYFFSQVDMKLVSRVLNMSRLTTDQLVWCHDKLSRISFVQRKIRVEPSFLLFPC